MTRLPEGAPHGAPDRSAPTFPAVPPADGPRRFLALVAVCGLVAVAAPSPAAPASIEFQPLRPGPGLVLSFESGEGAVEVVHGEVATFRFEDGSLFLSDGTDEVAIRPIPPPRILPVPLESFERLETMLGLIPRYEELVRHPEQIEPILRRYPMTAALADSLPDVLDPADPRVRRGAMSAYNAEQQAVAMWPALRELVDGEGGPVARARRAKRMLEDSPFVHSVEMDPDAAGSGGAGVFWFAVRFEGFFPDENGLPKETYYSTGDYEGTRQWLAGDALRPQPPITEDDARRLHDALAVLFDTGKAGRIDLSTGWSVSLSAPEGGE